MSKPSPIEYHLKEWSIVFTPDTFRGELHQLKDREYKATILWEAWVSEIDHPSHRTNKGQKESESFKTYDEAKVWIDENVEEAARV